MAKDRDVYHVTPNEDGRWRVKKVGNQKASGIFDRKTDAVTRGKELAKKGPKGQIKIHKQNGQFQTEYTYRDDPYPPEG